MACDSIAVSVRLFAGLREHAGTGALALRLSSDATAVDGWRAIWSVVDRSPPVPIETIALAINREYVTAGETLRDGDELSLIPPVSGGAPDPTSDDPSVHAAISTGPLDQAALHARVARREAGAIVVFSGTPRDVPQLDYEAHEQMAHEQMTEILLNVGQRHGACALAAEHRVGAVPWPEAAVVVAVSAPHREEAFAAAREALDRIKAAAPIWKQEVEGEHRAWVAGSLPTDEPVPQDAAAAAADAARTAAVGDAAECGERHPGGPLPHLRADGAATMVDVGGKAITERRAVAAAMLSMTAATAELIRRGDLPKGDVLGVARIAGMVAAKRVPDLVPLAHPLPLTKVDVQAHVVPELGQVRIVAEARTVGKTGVEIEAMTAALIAAINVYDMVKGVERGVVVGPVTLIAKAGGKSDFAGPAPWAGNERLGALAPAAATALVADPEAIASESSPGPRDAPPVLDPPVRVGLLTVSSSRADGPSNDPGTQALRDLAASLGHTVAVAKRVRDDRVAIADELRAMIDAGGCDLVLTAGGTGCTLDDLTPEATQDVCERLVPGIAEALRLASRKHTHAWPLSRGTSGIRGRTLVVNLPGNPKAAAEAEPVLASTLTHAVRLLRR